MKTITLKLTAVFFLSIFFTSCVADENGFYEDSIALNDVNISYTVMEYQIMNLVNEHRLEQGLPSLNIINLVSQEAEGHTDYMIGKGVPSHDNFSSRHSNLVAKVKAKSVGENVAYGYSTAESVVKAWVKSPAHKAIIENEKYTDFGISTKQNSEGRNYFTNIFVNRQ